MTPDVVGSRVCALRKKRGLTQLDLAHLLGFNDRQTISAIETGKRSLSATELITVVEELEESLDYFTDPFLLVGEGQFRWREAGAAESDLFRFEKQARYWLGAYRYLGKQIGQNWPLLKHSLLISKKCKFEDAMIAGERFTSEFELGEIPALKLKDLVQDQLGILVLDVDICPGISGGVGRLPEFDTVFLSRQETLERRNLDLAYGLFLLLTPGAMPSSRVEHMASSHKTRIEKLANRFTGALLMPSATVQSRGDWHGLANDRLVSQLNSVATELCVSSSALLSRLVELGCCAKSDADAIPYKKLTNNGHAKNVVEPSGLYSFQFANVIATAINRGLVSVRRACKALGATIDDFEEMFGSYGIECDIDL